MEKSVYLDYSATTPVKQEVFDAMLPYFMEEFGNPSSIYQIGIENKNAITKARQNVAALIGAEEQEIIFTSGGTESDNWALCGTVRMLRKEGKNHVITTTIEHHAIHHTCDYLKEFEGCDITYLPVDEKGRVRPEDLKNAITDKTAIVSIMMANNEIGTIQDIKTLSGICHEKGVLFHTDAVQALGNVKIDVKEMGIDMLSMSAHKIYGPKGIGGFYIRKGIKLPNLIHGGAQEKGRRAGTENVAGIVGFGKAAELALANIDKHIADISSKRDYFEKALLEKIPDIEVNGDTSNRLPGNCNILFHYIEGEALLLFMDIKKIFVSTGSACSSSSGAASHVLRACGIPEELALSTIRFTVGDLTTKEDLDYAINEIVMIAEKLRQISPFNKDNKWEV